MKRRPRTPLLAVAALLLVSGLTSCSQPRPDRSGTTPPGSSTRAATARDLVGAWESAQQGSNTTLAYRFTAEGKYKYVGLISYPMGEKGIYELTHLAEGTFRALGSDLTLRPSSASVTRKNPENPAGDHVNRPVPLETQRYRWKIVDQELSLTADDGPRLVFKWVSE
ncbi:hypothetical protein [Streptomyces cavernae]|uniref:hypothetical protein n=1 Tax=Streptomyces cavernae TaxID=2259034 RepID=UPI000FEBA16D|nr:hypothetical protein [Streptomyces cavernae]